MLDLRKIGDALQTGCNFLYYNERWPEDGDALQTSGVRITARIQYLWHYVGMDIGTF